MNKQTRGFTLIETIIVVGIIAVVLPLMFSIMYIILQQQVRLLQLNEVKKQGDFLLQYIESTVRNDAYGCSVDTAPGAAATGGIKFSDNDAATVDFTIDPTDIVPDTVTVTPFTLSCTTKAKSDGTGNTKPVVGVSFQITSRSNSQIFMRYGTKIQIRRTVTP